MKGQFLNIIMPVEITSIISKVIWYEKTINAKQITQNKGYLTKLIQFNDSNYI